MFQRSNQCFNTSFVSKSWSGAILFPVQQVFETIKRAFCFLGNKWNKMSFVIFSLVIFRKAVTSYKTSSKKKVLKKRGGEEVVRKSGSSDLSNKSFFSLFCTEW